MKACQTFLSMTHSEIQNFIVLFFFSLFVVECCVVFAPRMLCLFFPLNSNCRLCCSNFNFFCFEIKVVKRVSTLIDWNIVELIKWFVCDKNNVTSHEIKRIKNYCSDFLAWKLRIRLKFNLSDEIWKTKFLK